MVHFFSTKLFETYSMWYFMSIEDFIDKKFPVLDDGFVRLVDYMGDDSAIVQAARISYGDGTKKRSEDRALIRYMMRHQHSSPFEQCVSKWHIRLPMDCHRQLVRHRTSRLNEYSTRYSIAIDATQKTIPTQWRLQSSMNKQGSDGYVDTTTGTHLSARESLLHSLASEVYEERVGSGVALEQARKDLPLSTYTEIYWQMDLHNLLHFLSLRLDGHAQQEIRSYANVIADIVKIWCPLAWEAFVDYRLEALTFSRQELRELASALQQARQYSALTVSENLKGRELSEYQAKINHILSIE